MTTQPSLVGECAPRTAPPQRTSRLNVAQRALRIDRHALLSPVHQRSEMVSVDLGPVDSEHVTVACGPKHRADPAPVIGLQRPPHMAYMDLERRRRSSRRAIPPQTLDERVPIDGARRVHQQGSQQPLRHGPAEHYRRPRTQHPELSEYLELHRRTLPGPPGSLSPPLATTATLVLHPQEASPGTRRQERDVGAREITAHVRISGGRHEPRVGALFQPLGRKTLPGGHTECQRRKSAHAAA